MVLAGVSHPSALIPRQIPNSYEEPLTPSEAMYIHSLRDRDYLFGFANLQSYRQDGRRLWGVVLRRFGTALSSKPVRYGCVLYSLFKHELITGCEVRHLYLDQFYKCTRQAISNESFPELVYGCFAGCMYALRVTKDIEEIVQHTKGFRISVFNLKASDGIAEEEELLFECMWEKMSWYLGLLLLFESPTRKQFGFLKEGTQPLFRPGSRAQTGWIQESYFELTVKRKFIQLSIWLHHYPITDSQKVKESLWKRFSRDIVSPSSYDTLNLRRLKLKLWSKLIDFIFYRFGGISPQSSGSTGYTISILISIRSLIEHIPNLNEDKRLSVESVLDLLIYCLSFIGLNMREVQQNYCLG